MLTGRMLNLAGSRVTQSAATSGRIVAAGAGVLAGDGGELTGAGDAADADGDGVAIPVRVVAAVAGVEAALVRGRLPAAVRA